MKAISGDRPDFWAYLDRLVSESVLVIDRPKGSAHPRFPSLFYPLDYGCLANTTAVDGGGVDVWVGALGKDAGPPQAVICTVDLFKRDTEIKILLGCTEDDIETILAFHDTHLQQALLVRREKHA
ncbi:MAG: inorganic pyrophosphatase [Anaerolineae bacterium]|nr:inorganic pyrophosphatase [Anaerolineae bacterium]